MKLSDLVDYSQRLDELGLHDTQQESRRQLDRIMHVVTNHASVSWPKMYKGLQQSSEQFDQINQDIAHHINNLRRHAQHLIEEMEPAYYTESTRVWTHEMARDSNEKILSRSQNLAEQDRVMVMGKVLSWSDWRFPGLIIGPKSQEWVQHLVGLDPLYLVDQNLGLLDPTLKRFHEKYQQRLRLYAVDEKQHRPVLDALPQEQFSLIFAFDFFNYRPFEIVCKWLSELSQKLRSGGTLFFSFNDCDYAHGVALAEANFMSYTPGRRIVEHMLQTDLKLISRGRGQNDFCWMQYEKPGTLQTMRAGQNLAKIVARSK